MNNIFSIKNEDISNEELNAKKVVSAVDNAYKGTSEFAEMDTIATGQALHGRLSLTTLEVGRIADRLGYSEKVETPEGKTRYIRNPLRNCKAGFAFLSELNAMSEEERAALRMKWQAEGTNRRLNSLKLYKLYKGEKPKAPTKLEQIKSAFEDSLYEGERSKNKAQLTHSLITFHQRVAEIIEHDFALKSSEDCGKDRPIQLTKTAKEKLNKK